VLYREAPFREACIECRSDAAGRCPRCGDPCCQRHVYSDDGLCSECESEYLRRSADAEEPSPRAGAIGSAVIAIAIVASQAGGGLVVVVLGGVGAGLIAAAAHLGIGRRRRRFVLEKRR
jgi:hypothetical protein